MPRLASALVAFAWITRCSCELEGACRSGAAGCLADASAEVDADAEAEAEAGAGSVSLLQAARRRDEARAALDLPALRERRAALLEELREVDELVDSKEQEETDFETPAYEDTDEEEQVTDPEDEELPMKGTASGNPQCTGFPTRGRDMRSRCEGGNWMKKRGPGGGIWYYIYNEKRGTASAPCGHRARCWCCRKLMHFHPNAQVLAQPSAGPVLTFYAYQAKPGTELYPLENNNVASLGGVLWYLHNEVIQTCTGRGFLSKGNWGDRKFGIDHLRRIKLTVKPTQPLLDLGMHFGPLKSIDYGETTGPHRGAKQWGPGTGKLSMNEFEEYGYNVGCGDLGKWPHPDWVTGLSYPDATWYSLIGSCPQMDRKKESAQCKAQSPGGSCTSPDGRGSCTYSYEEAGIIKLDDLVGITAHWRNRADFCSRCRTEGGPWNRGGCGLSFWGNNINDKHANAARVAKVKQAFKQKYPDMPEDMPPPPCDFDRFKYGI